MSICPRSKQYTGCNLTGIPLRVIQSDGVEITPHISFSEAEIETGVKIFHNNSGKCDSFSITCLLNAKDTVLITKEYSESDLENLQGIFGFISERYEGDNVFVTLSKHEKIIDVLDYFIRKGEPFYVTTRAIGISKDELWLVTENSSRKQNYDDGYVQWSLTFTKDVNYNFATFKNTSKGVTKALKKYNKKKASAKKQAQKKAKAKSKTSKKSKFEKSCKVSQLKYSSKKKVVACVKLMQQILYKKGFLKKSQIDGWYGSVTKSAVKKFQKKYAKKYKLKQTGNVDKATFKALCKV